MSWDEEEELKAIYDSMYSPEFAARYNPPTNFTPTPDYIAESQGISPNLLDRVVDVESSWDNSARGSKGEVGFGQLMPGTADELDVDPFSEVQNLYGTAAYLDDMIDENDGDIAAGLASYNGGLGRFRKSGYIPQTADYAEKVLGEPLKNAPSFSNPSRYADVEIRSARMPYSRPGFSLDRKEDISQIAQEITGMESQKRSLLDSMSQSGRLDPDEAVAMALTAIIPALVGAGMGGLQGAAMGAQAGAAGAGVGLAGLTAENKERNARSMLMYNDINKRITTAEAERRALEKEGRAREERVSDLEFTETGKDRRSRQMANAMKAPDSPLEKTQLDEVQKFRQAAQTGVSMLDTINNEFGSMLGNKYRKEDGSIDWDGVKAIGSAKLGEIIGAGTVGSQLDSALKEQISQFIKSVSGTAASDTERAYLEGIIKGGGILPSDLPTIYKTIERIVGNQAAQAEGYIDLAVAARNSDPRSSIMSSFPKAPTMGAGGLDVPATSRLSGGGSGRYKIGQTASDGKGNVLTYTAEGWK